MKKRRKEKGRTLSSVGIDAGVASDAMTGSAGSAGVAGVAGARGTETAEVLFTGPVTADAEETGLRTVDAAVRLSDTGADEDVVTAVTLVTSGNDVGERDMFNGKKVLTWDVNSQEFR